jgi:hypothetical protein
MDINIIIKVGGGGEPPPDPPVSYSSFSVMTVSYRTEPKRMAGSFSSAWVGFERFKSLKLMIFNGICLMHMVLASSFFFLIILWYGIERDNEICF